MVTEVFLMSIITHYFTLLVHPSLHVFYYSLFYFVFFHSYCDVFQKCREVDPSGPLATLRKLLLSEESIASFKRWMQSNWYTVVLIVMAVIVMLVSLKHFFSRHISSYYFTKHTKYNRKSDGVSNVWITLH